MVILIVVLIILFFNPLAGQEICKVYFWDNAGPGATFPSPDEGDSRSVRSVDMMIEAINGIRELGLPFHDSIVIIGRSELPPPLSGLVADVPNIIFISLGWRGSGASLISGETMTELVNYIDSSYSDNVHAIYVEGNDLAWEYGDTSSTHLTYTGLMSRLGAVLRSDDYGVPAVLRGTAGSLADGLTLNYNTTTSGPTYSMDDMIIGPMGSPWAAQAYYVFDAGKGPARGLQRHSYPGSKRGPVWGAMVGFAFNFGNIINTPTTPSRTHLMYRILDFLKPPTCNIIYPRTGDTLIGGNICNIIYNVYDNCGIRPDSKMSFSRDGGLFWYNILNIRNITHGDTSYSWAVPEVATDAAYLLIDCWDNTGNYASKLAGPFHITILAKADESNGTPENLSISKIFPNPFNESAMLEMYIPVDSEYIVDMYDINARFVRRVFNGWLCKGPVRLSLRANGLPSGVYIVKCLGAGKTSFARVYVIR